MTSSSPRPPSRLARRLAAHPHANRLRRHTATILALRDEIQDALDDGWSRHAIWEALFEEQRVAIKYHSFLRYLRRTNILGPANHAGAAPVRAPAPAVAAKGFRYSQLPDEDLA